MEGLLGDQLYAQLCEQVHTKKPEEEPTFLKSLMNLACVILLLSTIIIIGTTIDCILRILQRKDLLAKEKQITIKLIQQNSN